MRGEDVAQPVAWGSTYRWTKRASHAEKAVHSPLHYPARYPRRDGMAWVRLQSKLKPAHPRPRGANLPPNRDRRQLVAAMAVLIPVHGEIPGNGDHPQPLGFAASKRDTYINDNQATQEGVMPPSTLHQTAPAGGAGRKTTRVTAACASCHRRSKRCSGERPACSACHTRGFRCEYPAETPKHGPLPGLAQRLHAAIYQLRQQQKLRDVAPSAAALTLNRKRVSGKGRLMQEPRVSYPTNSTLDQLADCQGSCITTSASCTLKLEQGKHGYGHGHDSWNSVSQLLLHSHVLWYIDTYCELVNRPMPMCHEAGFRHNLGRLVQAHAQCKRYAMGCTPLTQAQRTWLLQTAIAVALGAQLHNDMQAADGAAKLACTTAFSLFDWPDPDMARGLLMLSHYCTGVGQVIRGLNYNAIAQKLYTSLHLDIDPELMFLHNLDNTWRFLTHFSSMRTDGRSTGDLSATQACKHPTHHQFYHELTRCFIASEAVGRSVVQAGSSTIPICHQSTMLINDPDGVVTGTPLQHLSLSDSSLHRDAFQALSQMIHDNDGTTQTSDTTYSVYRFLVLLMIVERNVHLPASKMLVMYLKAVAFGVLEPQIGDVYYSPVINTPMEHQLWFRNHTAALAVMTPAHWHASVACLMLSSSDVSIYHTFGFMFSNLVRIHLAVHDEQMAILALNAVELIAEKWPSVSPLLAQLQNHTGQTLLWIEPRSISSTLMRQRTAQNQAVPSIQDDAKFVMQLPLRGVGTLDGGTPLQAYPTCKIAQPLHPAVLSRHQGVERQLPPQLSAAPIANASKSLTTPEVQSSSLNRDGENGCDTFHPHLDPARRLMDFALSLNL